MKYSINKNILKIALWPWKVGQGDPSSNLNKIWLLYTSTEEMMQVYEILDEISC